MAILQRIASEWAYLTGALRVLRQAENVMRHPDETVCTRLEQNAVRFANRPALVSTRESYTYDQLQQRINRYSRWLLSQGVKKGDVVSLFMPNRAEYVAIWLGVVNIGGICAWINTGLLDHSLAHGINLAKSRIVIVDASLMPAFETARGLLEQSEVFCYGLSEQAHDPRVDIIVETFSALPLDATERVKITIEDPAIYVYTSGTTGLPKAAVITHSRLLRVMTAYAAATNATHKDSMYVCLPLYHATGGICCVGTSLIRGGTLVIAEKFSASNFWNEVIQHQCTIFGYVGELCRYLLMTPPSASDQRHHIRLAFGNGLRSDIFVAFQKRFNIPHVLEFYAATEGNIALFNFDSKPGSVGRIPKWAERRFNIKIIAIDLEKEQPLRDANGFCIECAHGTAGEAIAEIVDDPKRPSARFDGYHDKNESQRKILRDVFIKGDAYFRSGDLLHRDDLGYYYFQDRLGDTFRWKGQNVSTSEVTIYANKAPGIQESNIYGIQVPGTDGRAGMAAVTLIDPQKPLDGPAIFDHFARYLPDYARPMFIRVQQAMDMTGTFKQRKMNLANEGFDPHKISDPIYFYDVQNKTYLPVTSQIYQAIITSKIRL